MSLIAEPIGIVGNRPAGLYGNHRPPDSLKTHQGDLRVADARLKTLEEFLTVIKQSIPGLSSMC